MKTMIKFKQYLPVFIFSALFFAATIESDAQNHGRKDRDEHKGHEFRDDHRNRPESYTYRHDERNYKYGRGDRDRHDNGRDYRSSYYSRYDRDQFCYEHPRYGRVYTRLMGSPVVFHHNRDDYYYYGNHFYTYRRGIGYCVIEPPREMYFSTLPVECERVYVNGHIFFRNGDLFFQLSPRGYAIVSSPIQINVSARF